MRSLQCNNLTDGGKDMSGVLKLAEAAKQSKLESLGCAAARACSPVRPRSLPCAACAPVHLACRRVCCRLSNNQLGPEGAAKLAEALKTNKRLKYLECVRPRTPFLARGKAPRPRPRPTAP